MWKVIVTMCWMCVNSCVTVKHLQMFDGCLVASGLLEVFEIGIYSDSSLFFPSATVNPFAPSFSEAIVPFTNAQPILIFHHVKTLLLSTTLTGTCGKCWHLKCAVYLLKVAIKKESSTPLN